MKRISTRGTFFRKRVLPIIFLGFPAVFIAVTSKAKMLPDQNRWPFILVPCVGALAAFVLWKLLISDLADEVYDLKDALLVKNRGSEATIPLRNIAKVSMSSFSNPVRVTIKLVVPCELGDRIVFEPLLHWTGFSSLGQEIVSDLERRCALLH